MTDFLLLSKSNCWDSGLTSCQMIFVFNKINSLERKLPISPVKKYFPGFKGDPGCIKK